jgi:16S rRNA U1498 N3-methylase RsmE
VADAVSSLNALPTGQEELSVVYASVEGVNEVSYHECLEELIHKAHGLGATALIALQSVQSQFQWNQRTSLLATAIRESATSAAS